MPNRPINFEFIADTAQALRSISGLEVTTEDLAAALTQVSESGEDLQRRLERAMREAARDTETLERAVRDLPDATEDAADEADRDFRRIGDSARERGHEAGSSFAGSLGEGLSSGDTSEVFQEVLGEMVGDISGPGSAAIAVGAGLALAVWNSFKAESERRKQELTDLFDITDLYTGAIEKVALMDEAIEDLGGGDKQAGLDKLAELSKTLGIPIGDITKMITGEMSPEIATMLGNLRGSARAVRDEVYATNQLSDENKALQDGYKTILELHDQQAEELELNAKRTETWQKGVVGVNDSVLDISASLGKVDANMDGAIDKADDLALIAADTNHDGYLDSIELAKAGLQEAVDKAVELNGVKFEPKTIPVKFDFADPWWAKQFSDPKSTWYNPGYSSIANMYRNNNNEGV